MQIEQMTYGSVKRRRMKGYQIIGKSSGIDAAMSSSFCQWAPSHNSLELGSDQATHEAWGLSFFALSYDHFAVARSVHGGPEYSGRGGFSVVTNALVMNRQQLGAYASHAVDIARTALALGHLILKINKDENLPAVTLTRRPLKFAQPMSDFADSTPPILPNHAVNWVAREMASLLRDNRKVMVVGKCDPLPILTLLLDQLTPKQRGEASFACGLKPSRGRDFRIQFTQDTMSPRVHKELDRSGIIPIDIARVLVETT